jgi:hypothetical protein
LAACPARVNAAGAAVQQWIALRHAPGSTHRQEWGDVEQQLSAKPFPAEEPAESASEILRGLAARPEAHIPFGEVVAAAGSRVHGIALFLFVLPETLPLPLPSASGILGIPLLIISAHLAIFGEAAHLPQRVLDLKIPRQVFVAISKYIGPILGWLEKVSRPRWGFFVREERAMGILCLYLSFVLWLPLPLVNAPPAICLAAVALGIIHRDGVLIAAGLVGAVIITAALFLVADMLARVGKWMWSLIYH